MNNRKTFEEILNGKLTIEIYRTTTRPCVLPVFSGLDAVKAWLSDNGGYASLKADYWDGQMTGWTIYRRYPEGHRAAGVIRAAA
jgi:hypothetical protein